MSYRDRIVNDGTDRSSWEDDRRPGFGASDAAGFAKLSSVDKYMAAKLATSSFEGNSYTASGHRWEPMLLAWAGIPQNLALIHAPDETGFFATPDGILELGDGRVGMAEAKAKHNKIVTGPSLGEWRQVSWQFLCVPEADWIEWVWGTIIDGELRGDQPESIRIPRDHPKVAELTPKILEIGRDLLPRLRAALAFEQELAA